jgi:chloramphenicol 3-O phosphotransferase
MSKVILLNGAGSSGKTSIARSIQHLSNESWLTFGIDTFIEMAPYPSPGKDGKYFSFLPGENDRGPLMTVEPKATGDKLFGVMADFALLLASQSNNLIIDEVLLDDQHLKQYIQKLSKHILYFVGVKCDLHIMQEREFLRQDRAIGLSNAQFDKVHNGTREYDLIVDTSNSSVFEVAKQILELVSNNKTPQCFNNNRFDITE